MLEWTRCWLAGIAILPGFLVLCCNEDQESREPDAGIALTCGKGLKPYKVACIPVFSKCKSNEVPLLGGGCLAVGVEACPGGVKGPTDSACRRLGVEACPGGIKGPPSWQCKLIGPMPKCPQGKTKVNSGWCEPLLPPAPCAKNSMAVMGETTCQPMADCGTGRYGKIKTSASTIFVDGSYRKGGSDGSVTKPYMTISAALKSAKPGAHIAVATGEYNEDLTVGSQVTIEGRCPAKVAVRGQGKAPAAAVVVSADKVTLKNLTVTGPATGVLIDGARSVVIDGIAVIDAKDRGIRVRASGGDPAEVIIRHSLIAGNRYFGISVSESKVKVQSSEVRDTRPGTSYNKQGTGIASHDAQLEVVGTVIWGNRTTGIGVEGTVVTVEKSMILHTLAQKSNNQAGQGIHVIRGSRLTVRDTIVAGNRSSGIEVRESAGIIQRSVIRDTMLNVGEELVTRGIGAISTTADKSASLQVSDSVVTANTTAGLMVSGAMVSLERVIVRDTRSIKKEKYAWGGVVVLPNLFSHKASEVTFKSSVITNNRDIGVFILGSNVRMEDSVVSDTQYREKDKALGMGIQATVLNGVASKLKMINSDVNGNRHCGISVVGSSAHLERCLVRGTRSRESDKLGGDGIIAELHTDSGKHSELTVEGSLVTGNRRAGLYIWGSIASVSTSIITKTQVRDSDKKTGVGIAVVQEEQSKKRGELDLSRTILSENHGGGLVLAGSAATVDGCVIRDTRVDGPGKAGVGILADAHPNTGQASEVTLTGSVLSGNSQGAAGFVGTKASIKGCEIRDTKKTKAGAIGVLVQMNKKTGEAGDLTITNTLVTRNSGYSVLVANSSGKIEGSVINDTTPDGKDPTSGIGVIVLGTESDKRAHLTINRTVMERCHAAGLAVMKYATATVDECTLSHTKRSMAGGKYGDGAQAFSEGKNENTTLNVRRSRVEHNLRAGLYYDASGGVVSGTTFRRNKFSIVLEGGANPSIGDDNKYIDNESNGVVFGRDLGHVKIVDFPEPPRLP